MQAPGSKSTKPPGEPCPHARFQERLSDLATAARSNTELIHGPRKEDQGGRDAGSRGRLFIQGGGGVLAAQKVSCKHSRREFFRQGTPGDPPDL